MSSSRHRPGDTGTAPRPGQPAPRSGSTNAARTAPPGTTGSTRPAWSSTASGPPTAAATTRACGCSTSTTGRGRTPTGGAPTRAPPFPAGSADPSGPGSPPSGAAGRGRSIAFLGTFQRCDDKTPPRPFTNGKSYHSCLAYLIPGGGSIQKVQWNNGPNAADEVSPTSTSP